MQEAPSPIPDLAVLLQQLAEVQKQCHAFVNEAEALRGQVAKLEGARDAAEGGLAAAQQELEQLKHVLRCELDCAYGPWLQSLVPALCFQLRCPS